MENSIYLNVSMVSEYLHVAKSTIYKWVGESYIPHKKLGKRVLFVKTDIDKWVLNDGEIIQDLPEVPKFKIIPKELTPEKHQIKSNYRPAV